MLSEHKLADRTFEELMDDARMQIPLYSKDWTNFNPSDPGITTLETLSAYTLLQQAFIGEISDVAKEKLFSLLGYRRQEGRNSRVMLQALNVKSPFIIPSGQRFTVGELSFETNRETAIYGNKVLGIYGSNQGKIKDYSSLLDKDVPLDVAVFSENPQEGMDIYIVLDSTKEMPEEINFYVDVVGTENRNVFEGNNLFANIKWKCYTEKGFVDIKCKDNTACFLSSGEIRFKFPKAKAAVYNELPQKGYVIRGTLNKANYDMAPKLKAVYGFLFEVWQKDTYSICYTFSGTERLEVYCDLLELGYIQMFCKEEDGFYYKYEYDNGKAKGRYYQATRDGYGRYIFEFNKEERGYGPAKFDNGIKLVAYNEDIMQQYDLGIVYGYDNQSVELPIKNIIKDSFSLIVGKINQAGETIYEFVRPNSKAEDDFKYTINEDEGTIVIEDAADFINGHMYCGGCAVTMGEEGNVRAGTIFTPYGYDTEVIFFNPAVGAGGKRRDTLADLKKKVLMDMNEHYTATTASDYENIVKTTPELCIHKVKAVADRQGNKVNIAVKPYSKERFPVLSNIYKDAISKRLGERRLLTTRIEIMQPVYTAIDVQCKVCVKPHFERCKEQIEKVIVDYLDYINSDKNFGERMSFDELFGQIEALSCVDFIYDINVMPQNYKYVEMLGIDILPADNCLLYPGNISINLTTN